MLAEDNMSKTVLITIIALIGVSMAHADLIIIGKDTLFLPFSYVQV
jgi:hypothetical protein